QTGAGFTGACGAAGSVSLGRVAQPYFPPLLHPFLHPGPGLCDNGRTMFSGIRVLSNLPLPSVEGYSIRTFGDYLPGGPDPAWRPQSERRDLADILPLIPLAEKPDILLFSTPEYLPIPLDLAAFPGIRILLITDWNVCLRFLPDLCPLFDFCFTDWPGYRLMRRGGVANVHHQPLFGHDPAVFGLRGKTARDLDVSFCGSLNQGLHGERNRLLARLARWGRDRRMHLS